ncbi:MAG: CoB--CoM heterodisulfide reductase iron-sulfur subunit A family protein [Firmicutes bacterium]|nr:CoB--CoM heterodisulfide reductase iron-sulfur subunit A family protein [Bacillota bacterium]
MKRIGVFVCHCGTNIAATVDVEKVAESARHLPHVVFATTYKFMCADPGQKLIADAIREHALNRVVVAACSPHMHERTFRKAVERAGVNPYLMEVANVREQCSWVHRDKPVGTEKAAALVAAAVAKVARNVPLESGKLPVERRALVVGGGIAGIQAALDIAESGYHVTIVEREQSVGGRMAQLDKTFPTLDCSSCILTPKMVDVGHHPMIEICSYSEIESVEGYVGNFEVTIRRKATSVDPDVCTGCGECWNRCPVKKLPSSFNMDLGHRPAIYVDFPQAIPNVPVIDRANCTYYLRDGKCRVCEKVCPTKAIDFTLEDRLVKERFGAIVMATGFQTASLQQYPEWGLGTYPDVVTGLHFERLVSSTGPTEGKIKRPSDGKEPKSVVFVLCAGSRDEARGRSYCSKACCMYSAKQAILLREKIPQAQAHVFYMDIRTAGKDYEEFYMRAKEEYGVNYIRGRVAKVYPEKDHLVVRGEDTLLGRPVAVEADMVVLAAAIEPRADAAALAQKVGISYNRDHFFSEAHPKLRPVESNTGGVFLAGCCQGPKDIPETVAQASAAAAKVVQMFSKDALVSEAQLASVNEAWCIGCFLCQPVCPYKAIQPKEIEERRGRDKIKRTVSSVNTGLCQGCGACAVACPSGAMRLNGFTDEQILAEVDAVCL